jgi:hypothetical protein
MSLMYDAIIWNWSKFALCDDALFITSYINHALSNEIRWSTSKERVRLGIHLCELPRCIRFIDGTLVEICKPWQNEVHCTWFNGWKKIYAMNNIVFLDHQGLFIYINGGYLGSFHDVNILQHLNVYRDWR